MGDGGSTIREQVATRRAARSTTHDPAELTAQAEDNVDQLLALGEAMAAGLAQCYAVMFTGKEFAHPAAKEWQRIVGSPQEAT